MVPDKNGDYANVIQGHDNIQDVINSPEPYLSTLIGRYGNRICKGEFQLNGKKYQLAINNGPNSLHGGKSGFNTKVWDALMMNNETLILNYVSSYGEEGYTGEVKVTVAYIFNDDNELIIEYMATTNKKTVINLTSHGYFSLAGIANPTPTIDNLICEINADFYLPIDETSIPTGEIRLVKDTPFDFRTPKTIGQDINADNEQIKNGAGYDHCFVLNKKEEGERLLKRLGKDDFVVLLDLKGSFYSSEELATQIDTLISKGVSPISFVTGGTLGLSEEVRQRANIKLSISKMTFTHQMCRMILLEQIYRAFKIINHEDYHH